MESRARLVPTHVPDQPTAVVLVLHGGAARPRPERVRATQLSVLRMVPIASRIAARSTASTAVYRLLNSYRGWEPRQSPVDDVHWALDQISSRYGSGVPASLVGHSLGARSALLSGTHPNVVSVVALNAYLDNWQADVDLSGRSVVFAHGTRDRVASLNTAESVARRLAATTHVEFVHVHGGNHSMLTRREAFETLAAASVTSEPIGRPSVLPGGQPRATLHIRTI